MLSTLPSKTFKREIAVLFAGVLCYAIYQGEVEMVEAIVWPFVSYIAAASGLHIWDKQLLGGSSQPADRRRP